MLTIGAAAAQEQVGSIRGVVRDREFDGTLAEVQVSLSDLGVQALTTDQGNYVLPEVPAGKYTIVFAKPGYLRLVRSDVVVTGGRLTELDVVLAGDFTDMEEFVVQDVLNLGGGATELSLLELRFEAPAMMDSIGSELMTRAGASDAASALRLVSGASLQNGKSAVIRGLPDRYVSSQLNGVRLPTADEDKRAVELDQFASELIESIQVSKTFTPDQQGDASGGAVNLRLKSVPTEPFFVRWKVQGGFNSQVRDRNDFLTYEGGGVDFDARDDGGRRVQTENLGQNWDGAVGVSTGQAQPDHKLAGAIGGSLEIGDGVKVGGLLSLFHDQESSFYNDGKSDSWWVESPGAPMTPQYSQGSPLGGDFKTALYDVTQGKQSVQWGELAALGVQSENHYVGLLQLSTRVAEDTATLAVDTRGKQFFFPGYNPTNPASPGYSQPDAAPYLRLETLDYTERTTETLQLHGRHKLGAVSLFGDAAPELDWFVARSTASLSQPDKRQFSASWTPSSTPGIPGAWVPYKPAENFNLGNLQRIFKDIEENSTAAGADLEIPLRIDDQRGYVKTGLYYDDVERDYLQETFSNFGDNSFFIGPFEQPWSGVFPFENHPITASEFDVDYRGKLQVAAAYAMVDLPVLATLNVIGGVRLETTEISTVNVPESLAFWFPPGTTTPTVLNPGDADVDFEQTDWLPALALVFRPGDGVTVRAAYSQTIARQTFKELTPILQQEYLGGPIFIGNPELEMSALQNYDLRLDYEPYQGGLFSASLFQKDIDGPIEYVQQVASFEYTTARNYPQGRIRGIELETRQRLEQLWDPLAGMTGGLNVTLLDSRVDLPADEVNAFNQPNIQAPTSSRDMTDAPEYLLNLFLVYDLTHSGTQIGAFYTLQGDTLVAGATTASGRYVPDIYATEVGRLNLTLTQKLSEGVFLQVQAKNLTNPAIETVYRSDYTAGDVTRSSYSEGVDFAIALGGEVKF